VSQFNHDAMRRIGRVIRRAELAPKGGDQPPADNPNRYTAKVFVVTTQVQAMTGTTPGKGFGTMQLFDRDVVLFRATSHTAIAIFNLTTVKIVVGAYVQCVWLDGAWFYDVTACGNGAT
jgi:hypothetical protein